MTATESGEAARRPGPVTKARVARAAAADQDAATATAALYTAYYRPLVRLAVLLVRDLETAEDVVQDSFIAMHANWRRLNDRGSAASYLRQCVVNRSRSALRRRSVAERHPPQPPPDMPSAEAVALERIERSAVIAALHRLTPRQREALVLRYYADLSGTQTAAAMGISLGAVKCHTNRAISALRNMLKWEASASATVAMRTSGHPAAHGRPGAQAPAPRCR